MSSLVLLVFGYMWRYSYKGEYCAGDAGIPESVNAQGAYSENAFMIKSGNFMGLVIWFQLALIIIGCVISLLAVCCGAKKAD